MRRRIAIHEFAAAPSLCHGCAHLQGSNPDGTARCSAFATIPARIWQGQADHRSPVAGDGGTTFQPMGEYGRSIEAQFLAAREPVLAALEGPSEAPSSTVSDGAGESPTVTGVGMALVDAPPEEWHAVLAVEGTSSGDGRRIVPGALTWRSLPLPITWQEQDTEGHDDAFLVSHITRYEARGPEMHVWGHYLDAQDGSPGARFKALLEEAGRLGVSVTLDDVTVEFVYPPGSEDDPFAEPESADIVQARVMGGTVVMFPAFQECFIEPVTQATEADVLVAAAIPVEPPAEWFTNPMLDGPTPLTVTADGRVYGHLATWGSCHTGFHGTCVTPPHEETMDYFTTGQVLCSDGSFVQVGQITLGTGHAGRSLDPVAAAAHYDHTGTSAADVAAGPDDFGIWLAGALRPGTTPEDVRALRAAAVSGDWRRINGQLRLLGVLAVNVPGFPVPRTSAFVHDGQQTALVAAGVVVPVVPDLEPVAELLAERIGRDRRSLVASLTQRVHVGEFACAPCAKQAEARAAAKKARQEARQVVRPQARPAPSRTASAAGVTRYDVVAADGGSVAYGTLVEAMKAKRAAGPGARMRIHPS